MLEKLKTFLSSHALLAPGEKVLVSFSGGRDSVCLAHLLCKAGYEVALAHVNHGLRGKASEKDEEFARKYSKLLGIEIYVHRERLEKGPNLQARAREVRYDFLEKTAGKEGFGCIATAHHRDDHLETFLVQLLRGGSLASLGGIPAKNGRVIRPLLFATREEINHYIEEEALTYREDASNDTPVYTRNRVRKQWLPLLRELEAHAEENLFSVMERLRQQTEAVHHLAQTLIDTQAAVPRIDLHTLPAQDPAFWLYEAVKHFGFTRTQCSDILRAKHGGKEVRSGNLRMVRSGNHLEIHGPSSFPADIEMAIDGPGHLSGDWFSVRVTSHSACEPDGNNLSICIDADKVAFPIIVAPWKPGDRFQPLGLNHEVEVRKFLRDKKVAKAAREKTFVAWSGDRIFWIPGIAMADWAKITEGTSQQISLEFSYIRE